MRTLPPAYILKKQHDDAMLPLQAACQRRAETPRQSGTRPNPVVESAEWVYDRTTDLVTLNECGIARAATYIARRLVEDTYTPSTWRTQPLHLCPPDTFSRSDPRTRSVLNWIFLVSSLNFSFWSDLDGKTDDADQKRFGVEWRAGWGSEKRVVWDGYWSLVAAIDKALENGIPITDPEFYASLERCPDSVIAEVFKPAPGREEEISLLPERIDIMRQVGGILCKQFNGSFLGFLDEFDRLHGGPGHGTALQLVQMVTDTFPSFRDESHYAGRRVVFWKRAQILVAETWAAFHPLAAHSHSHEPQPHPLFPRGGVHELTMFADYRVPQILHHLGILAYSPGLQCTLLGRKPVPHGSREELAIRAASVLAVEAVRGEIGRQAGRGGESKRQEEGPEEEQKQKHDVTSVIIDFYLWDLAKRIEGGQDAVVGITTQEMLPAHRTRSIWY